MNETVMTPVHPGEILKMEFLEPAALTAGKLALKIGVPPQRLYDLIAGKRAVSLDTDLRLCRYFGMSRGFFLGLQQLHDLQCAEEDGLIKRIDAEVQPRALETPAEWGKTAS